MLMADTVMDADEPRFQIGEDEMDDRQIVLGNLWVAALGNGKVFIPALAEAGISTPIVSDGQRPRSNGALHEPTKRVGAPIGYYGEPDTPGIASVLSLVLRGSRFPMTNLDGTSDENLVVDTPAFAASPSTNPCLVYLNMFPRLAADTILIGPHHASAELVENAEGRLIARQAKLSLKLNRRDAGRLAGDQISRPKPCAQRHMAAFHDGANRQARIVAALATAQDTGTSGDAEGIACGMAMRTDEAVAPSSFFHVGSTLRFIGKKLLKLWKRPRKGQVVTLKDVHGSLSIIHTKSIPSGCVRQADRQESKENRAKVRKEFNRQRIDAALAYWNERIRESWCDLYEMTIDFGAHPNELSITSGMQIRRDEDAFHIQYVYLQGDGYALDFGLVSLQRVAECVLRIFQELFPVEFGSSGVSSKLVELQKDLRGFKLDLPNA